MEYEASKLREGHLATHPPVAMRTFVGKAMQPRLDNFAQSGSACAHSYNSPRIGVPQGLYEPNWVPSSVSRYRQLHARDSDGKT